MKKSLFLLPLTAFLLIGCNQQKGSSSPVTSESGSGQQSQSASQSGSKSQSGGQSQSASQSSQGGSSSTSKAHVHTYATEWSSDENQHWHAATCEHTDQKGSLGDHKFVDYAGDETHVVVDNGCEGDSVLFQKCSTCGYIKQINVPAGHNFVAGTEVAKDGDNVAYLPEECSRDHVKKYTWSAGDVTENCKTNKYHDEENIVASGDGWQFWGRPIGNAMELDANGGASSSSVKVPDATVPGSFFEYKFNAPEAMKGVKLIAELAPAQWTPDVFKTNANDAAGDWTPGYRFDGDGTSAIIDDFRYVVQVNGQNVELDSSISTPANNSTTKAWFDFPGTIDLVAGVNTIKIIMAGGYKHTFYSFGIETFAPHAHKWTAGQTGQNSDGKDYAEYDCTCGGYKVEMDFKEGLSSGADGIEDSGKLGKGKTFVWKFVTAKAGKAILQMNVAYGQTGDSLTDVVRNTIWGKSGSGTKPYVVKVGETEANVLINGKKYGETGVTPEGGIVDVAELDLVAGENVISFTTTSDQYYRNIFQGKIAVVLEPVVYEPYVVTFDIGEHAKVEVFKDKDLTMKDYGPIFKTRDGDTGKLCGDPEEAQINFKITVEDGYAISAVSVPEGTYNKIKCPALDGVENSYRITKVSSNLTIKIETASQSALTGFNITVLADEHAHVTVYTDKTFTTPDTAEQLMTRNGENGNYTKDPEEAQINLIITFDEGYELSSLTATEKMYKNIKGPSDTKVANGYRITKITGDIEISIKSKEVGQ